MPETNPPPPSFAGLSLDAIAAAAAAAGGRPVERWDPPACGDSGMRIAADGRWFHHGAPIARPAMVRLFAGLLRRDPDGYRLVTPVEKLAIAVDDLPFTAVEVAMAGAGAGRRLAFRLNTDEPVVAGPDHPLAWEAAGPRLRVRGGLHARIARPVYYELVDAALADAAAGDPGAPSGLWSDGAFFPLPPA